jgi:hypothetical protein
MPILVLTFLAAITSAFGTLPSNIARAEVTYALLHPVGDPSNCQSSWDGIEPSISEYDVFLASCTLINDPALTTAQQQTLISDLPRDCYPPNIPPTCADLSVVNGKPHPTLKPPRKPTSH